MAVQPITSDMTVWRVISTHPETFEIFRKHGCPDMRRGLFALMARITSVRTAARRHKIPVDDLIRDLNVAIGAAESSERR